MRAHKAPPLLKSFDAAIAQVARLGLSGVSTPAGDSLARNLDQLAGELRTGRAKVESLGSIDREWIKTTIRWAAEWIPDDGLPLLASLGAIVRAAANQESAT